jgi:diaminohydroxyphosphoribosylaminopyrimidine deaminase / 5-amino-6-(5-phosphoribosylamino)uracil reductase
MATEFSHFDRQCMARAITLARFGWYTAHPNPRVGCVIASKGSVVGEGYHLVAGEPHAEINALRAAGSAARGAVAYVTLEPCNHVGRTGPCARALIDAGVAEVVYGMTDPHQQASGGIATLVAAGVRVRGPLMESQAVSLNPGFIKRCQTGLPRVTVKVAMSLDGRTAMANGESQWITGPGARGDVQKLRARSGAVITGIGTVLADNPSMTVRAAQLPSDVANRDTVLTRQPLRVVVDSKLRTPRDAAILSGGGQTLIATAVNTGSGYPDSAEFLQVPLQGGRVDLRALLLELAHRQCNDVLVEAGAELAGAFMRQGLADELVVYMAPRLLGSLARPMLSLPFDTMAEVLDLEIEDCRAVGDDWKITGRPKSVERK